LAPALALALFFVSALVTLGAASVFADKLDHIGPRIGLPESAVGLLTAAAADTPEIASAIVALVAGHEQASLGVVIGSNVFNLAAMIGLSGLLAGSVTVGRDSLMLEGAVSVLALLLASLLIVGVLSAPVSLVLFLAVVGPYVVVTLRRDHRHDRGARSRPHVEGGELIGPIALLVPAVALIVLGSTGMVKTALSLADRYGVSQTVTGLFVLAVLTSLPNAFTGVRLGLGGRGDALVTETLASNTINLTGGVLVPALFVGIATATRIVYFDLVWLAGMTVVTLVALASPRGLGRVGGALLVGLYVVFVVVHLARG
jgi:cation:H+ antiporter